ncbi:hypothetical protein SAMN05660831_02705 [Thiohalospira halophila DSM 15071]|uniref:Mobilisation protein (MobC) n=1 Tax=Thiohalospira halophila DSM 15071 TaxID=1123397 RepID=A0A1I1WTS9_9GAMM|nr:mobilization protein [Thiohalospira halophila]SFD96853.1 hypothetical protein SAMN05660831_02705 [Thiohalospira halophila DSM 15071]
MGKRGPAPLAEGQRRTRRVSVYLTPAEYQRLADAAPSGRSVADALRRAALGRRVEAPPPVPEVNREAWRALARSVGNLNQLAHHANAGRQVDGSLRAELSEVRALVETLRKELVGEGEDHTG